MWVVAPGEKKSSLGIMAVFYKNKHANVKLNLLKPYFM